MASGLFAVVFGVAVVPEASLARLGVAAVAFIIVAIAQSAMMTGAIALIDDVTPVERESKLMGLYSISTGLGGFIGPPVIGAIATFTSYSTSFIAGSVLSFVAAVLVTAMLTESNARSDASRFLPE